MFCYQCQETAKNEGCTVKGMCGKPEETANLQDLLIYTLRGLAIYGEKAKELGISDMKDGLFVAQALFATITNANFDNDRIIELIKEALNRRETLKEKFLAAYKEKNGQDFDEAAAPFAPPGFPTTRLNFMKKPNPSAFLPPKMRMYVP